MKWKKFLICYFTIIFKMKVDCYLRTQLKSGLVYNSLYKFLNKQKNLYTNMHLGHKFIIFTFSTAYHGHSKVVFLFDEKDIGFTSILTYESI